jgi:hypothetical protein
MVLLAPGPDRADRFEAAQGDALEFHFIRPEPGKFSITFHRLGARDVRVTAARVDEYRLHVTIPSKVRRGPWRVVVGRQGATQELPMTLYVHQRP